MLSLDNQQGWCRGERHHLLVWEETWAPVEWTFTWDFRCACYLNTLLATCQGSILCCRNHLQKSPLTQKANPKWLKETRDEAEGRQFPDKWLTEYITSLLSAKKSLLESWHLSEFKNVPFHTQASWLNQFHMMNQGLSLTELERLLCDMHGFFLCESRLSQHHESKTWPDRKVCCTLKAVLKPKTIQLKLAIINFVCFVH